MTDESKEIDAVPVKNNKKPDTILWILLSIVSGIIGGGIAWLVLRAKRATLAMSCLAIGAAVTVFTGGGILLAALLTESPDKPLYTYDQVLAAAQVMSPECYTEET